MDSDTTRTVDEICAELASNRQSLAGVMEDLVDSVKPANIASKVRTGGSFRVMAKRGILGPPCRIEHDIWLHADADRQSEGGGHVSQGG